MQHFKTILPARPRVRRKRRVVAPCPCGAVARRLAVPSQFVGTTGQIQLFFNTTEENPIQSVEFAAPSKWTARVDGVDYVGTVLDSDTFSELSVLMEATGSSAGPDVLNYSNDPSDILMRWGDSWRRLVGCRCKRREWNHR